MNKRTRDFPHRYAHASHKTLLGSANQVAAKIEEVQNGGKQAEVFDLNRGEIL